MSKFVIITPAHNEAAFLEKTIASVVAQRIRPLKWVIVDDASTDRTAEIVERFLPQYPFIELLRVQRPAGRDFRNKVRAFNKGMARLRGLEFEFVGNLDADISMEADYYQRILAEFEKNPRLGIAGGMVHSCVDGIFISQEVALDSVAGAVQLFRKCCFEQTGGYTPLPHGGIDAAAEIVARMNGWETRTFPDIAVLEHRRTGSATARPLASRLKEGRRFHSLGYGFLFFAVRCLYRLLDRPRVLGSGAALVGYLDSAINGKPVALPAEVVQFLRGEQRAKLRRALRLPG
jgi:glycosyltransferase involved in cell wall biosynthesis